jgi:hypothetical protein
MSKIYHKIVPPFQDTITLPTTRSMIKDNLVGRSHGLPPKGEDGDEEEDIEISKMVYIDVLQLTIWRVVGDPCHPTIVVPDRLKSVRPAWETCVADAIGG